MCLMSAKEGNGVSNTITQSVVVQQSMVVQQPVVQRQAVWIEGRHADQVQDSVERIRGPQK